MDKRHRGRIFVITLLALFTAGAAVSMRAATAVHIQTEYLDPLDGPGWRAAILDYAAPASPRRAAQIARLAGWQPPRWREHFAMVNRFIAEAPMTTDCGGRPG